MPKKIKFGTDGWRAIVGQDFNLNNVEIIAQAIADYLLQTANCKLQIAKVAVGYDNRKLSPQAARCIAGVLAANKIKVVLSDRPLPTQAVSYAVRSQKCIAGIMVTASHNHPKFNGIKVKGAFGGSLESKDTAKIEKLLFRNCSRKIPLKQASKLKLFKTSDLVSGYLKLVMSYLDMRLLKRGCLKVLVDPMHGTANSYVEKLLKNTPSKVTTIHKNQDHAFGGVKPEPIASCLKETSAVVKNKDFEIALVTDGDADRIAALDGKGRFMNPQEVIVILALYLIRYRKLKGALVKTISGTALFEAIAKKYRLKVYETPVGFKHIANLMRKRDILIGGEEGGGIGFKNYLPERDGILAGLLLLEAVIVQDKPISELWKDIEKEFGRHVYLRKDLKCPVSEKHQVKTKLKEMRKRRKFFKTTINKIDNYDGLKFYLDCGSWILFRLSGTEPILRIYAESNSAKRTKKLIQEGCRMVRS